VLASSFLVGCGLAFGDLTAAQSGTVLSEQRISETEGGFGGALDPDDRFGSAVALLGDLDGDGVSEIAVGTPYDDDGGLDKGAVWILFLRADGTVRTQTKISDTRGGFGGVIGTIDFFGTCVAGLGDLNGDGIGDLAVGVPNDNDRGAVWILFLDTDGTVQSERKIAGRDSREDFFGRSVANLGDFDGDGIVDLAVGANGDDDGGMQHGALWILLLNADGTVKSEQKISETSGGGAGELAQLGYFGYSATSLGDLDRDGTGDVAVGEIYDDEGGSDRGAVWILFLEPDGTLKDAHKLSAPSGVSRYFGVEVKSLGDLDGDGNPELAASSRSIVWILFLAADGTAKSIQSIGEGRGGFEGHLEPGDYFGDGLENIGDLDGDGNGDLAVGAIGDGGALQGALWILFLGGPRVCVNLDFETEDDLVTPLVNGQHIDAEFGSVVALSSTGPNAGLAIFDSTPGGPNDPSQDRDLLVDTGNILILQTENLPPDANDVFPRPNDDEDGGTIVFECVTALEPQSLRLIDLDAGDGATQVELRDAAGRRRTYTVPSNWTGDRALSQPGQGVLDLTTLAPQPGFGSTASAVEDPGFAPAEVVRIEVRLDGSGGLDDLSVCLASARRASARIRNGTGVNPTILSATSMPVLGTSWEACLDCPSLTGAVSGLALLEVRRAGAAGRFSPFGEVLIGGAVVYRTSRAYTATPSSFTCPIPYDLSLCGLELHVQALCIGTSSPSGPKLRAASGLLSNAVDLVLGF
jgi:hypothetical protein